MGTGLLCICFQRCPRLQETEYRTFSTVSANYRNIWVPALTQTAFSTAVHANTPHYLPTCAVCLQLWPHCFSVLCDSSSSCLSREVSAQGPEGRRVGGVPGEPWPDGKCSQIFVLMPLRPTKKRRHINNSHLHHTYTHPELTPTNLKSYEMVPGRCFLIGQVGIGE